jgi:hypothetical protein
VTGLGEFIMMKTTFLKEDLTVNIRLIAITLPIILGVSPLFAATIDEGVDATKMGMLDQALTNCPNEGCGPTAAVNSFVYLQNMFGSTYDNKLVPTANSGDKPNQNLIDVANTLLGQKYMNVTCGCDTDIRDFIFGKDAYINDKAPGSTRFRAQMNDIWALPGGRPIPPDVRLDEKTAPTIGFLSTELHDKEDVEILLRFPDNTGHYVTVTHLTWDTDKQVGTLDFIDPDQGMARPGTLSQSGTSPLQLKYTGADNTEQNGTIFAAISESPSPEPETLLTVGAGLSICAAYRIRRPRRNRINPIG